MVISTKSDSNQNYGILRAVTLDQHSMNRGVHLWYLSWAARGDPLRVPGNLAISSTALPWAA